MKYIPTLYYYFKHTFKHMLREHTHLRNYGTHLLVWPARGSASSIGHSIEWSSMHRDTRARYIDQGLCRWHGFLHLPYNLESSSHDLQKPFF